MNQPKNARLRWVWQRSGGRQLWQLICKTMESKIPYWCSVLQAEERQLSQTFTPGRPYQTAYNSPNTDIVKYPRKQQSLCFFGNYSEIDVPEAYTFSCNGYWQSPVSINFGDDYSPQMMSMKSWENPAENCRLSDDLWVFWPVKLVATSVLAPDSTHSIFVGFLLILNELN